MIRHSSRRSKLDAEIENGKQIVFYFRMFLSDLSIIKIPDTFMDWTTYIVKHRYNKSRGIVE